MMGNIDNLRLQFSCNLADVLRPFNQTADDAQPFWIGDGLEQASTQFRLQRVVHGRGNRQLILRDGNGPATYSTG